MVQVWHLPSVLRCWQQLLLITLGSLLSRMWSGVAMQNTVSCFSSMLALLTVCLPCGLGKRSRRYMAKQMLILSDFMVAVANLYYFGDGVLYCLPFSLVFSFL